MTYNSNGNANTNKEPKPKMKKRRRCRNTKNVCLLLTGILLISLGLSIFIYFEAIYDWIISDAMTFDAESKPFHVWKKNDPPLDMDIYIFNWTNPEELKVKGKKPRFQEIGPYRFKEIKEKINITWNDHNNSISYMHKKLYFYDAENSARKLTDRLTILNVVPLTVAYKARHFGYFMKKSISLSLSALSKLYVTKTAGEILFEGYEESILSVLSSVPLAGVQRKFGMFYGKNDTSGDDGIFNMHTSTDSNYGKIISWNYRNRTTFYGTGCSDVRGSAGEFYPINRERDSIEIFSPELCKFARLEYEHDVRVKGVLGYKYTAKNIFDNGTLRPENRCFCNGDCIPSGVFNVSACRQDSPTFLSMPHFYNADPYYLDAIEGLKPTEEHEFYITLQPKSGIVIDIAPKMQVNMLLQPVEYIKMYEDVPKIYFPMFYFTQRIMLKDELASSLLLIERLPDINNLAVLISIFLGVLSLSWIVLDIYCCSRRKNDQFMKQTANGAAPIIEEVPLNTNCIIKE